MKVTLLAHTIPQSGITGVSRGIRSYVYNLAIELRKFGNDVELLIRNDYKPKEKWVKAIYSPKFSWILYPIFATPHVAFKNSDVYHSDYVTTGLPFSILNKRPFVVSMHDAIPFMYKKEDLTTRDKIIVSWYMTAFNLIKNADAILVLTNTAKEQVLQHTDISEEKIHVVYPGVDFKKFFPLKKKSKDTIIIGYLGGLAGRKNISLLIESFKILVKQYDNIELKVGGSGSDVGKFVAMNIPNSYFYSDIPNNQVNEFLNSLDIFVFPTLLEGFGLPPLEAMASGVPVVATKVSTMPEVVGDAGILVEPNIRSMIKGLSKLIENAKLRKKLRQKGLSRAKRFTWKRCAESTLAVYETVIKSD